MNSDLLFQEVDRKKKELHELKLSDESRRVLDEKFRLERSYHSNHIEGSTLTYGETKLLLLFGKTSGNHEKREFDEMEAHDVAVKLVDEWAMTFDRKVTEADIRELNRVILVKPYWKEAITLDRQSTRKLITPGEYKSTPNSVLLKNGEYHNYASPTDVPQRMQKFTNDINSITHEHPVLTAALLHHQFTDIHPFDDGNGRVARLLLNYQLIRAGYPPVLIKSENKQEYLGALEQADAGEFLPLVEYFLKELNWSLDISIKAAKGEPIDEPEDLDKRIEIVRRKLNTLEDVASSQTVEATEAVVMNCVFHILREFEEKLSKLAESFAGRDRNIYARILGNNISIASSNSSWEQIKEAFLKASNAGNGTCASRIEYTHVLKGFKKRLTGHYISTMVVVDFYEFNYALTLNQANQPIHLPYTPLMSNHDMDVIVMRLVDPVLKQLEIEIGRK